MHLLSWEVLEGHEDNLKIRLERDALVTNYAILSHVWGSPKDEVSFEDMLAGTGESKKGYAKLVGCCKQAQKDGLAYIWVNTCCINKASSAELSEAIVSMFQYYEQSEVCYAYLEDVLVNCDTGSDLDSSSFSDSAWFTRAWTLQELVAPQHVKFFDRSWAPIGHKVDEHVRTIIERVTRIDSTVLTYPFSMRVVSVAKKMSWAAERRATRTEDKAYSLMGIFGVYMPPLYGEGNHAFIRLQEAILRTSNDHTIFAWTSPPAASLSRGLEYVSTMLALSPDQFKGSSEFRPLPHTEHGGHKLDYNVTNAGLSIRLPLLKVNQVEGLYAGFLSCTEGEDHIPSAILLRSTKTTPTGHFWRTNINEGSTARNGRRWGPTPGRETIEEKDVYILPRFTMVSGDNIEPPWAKIESVNTQDENTTFKLLRIALAGEEPSFAINPEVLRHLNYTPDPSFQELAFLRQAHQLISSNKAYQLASIIKTSLPNLQKVPQRRNENFCGRAEILQKLRDTFSPSVRDTKILTISGMAGVGKTELVIQFCHDCIESSIFDAVLWISAASGKEIHDDFLRIATELNLAGRGSPPEQIVNNVLRWLSDFKQYVRAVTGHSHYSAKWLLVFDSADDVSLLHPFCPLNGPGCVLVTSRDASAWFTLNSGHLPLESLTADESLELLNKLTRSDWESAHAIHVSKLLGRTSTCDHPSSSFNGRSWVLTARVHQSLGRRNVDCAGCYG
ncbi:het domain protein [Phlyctema vagabunda]|uniref:Het domain protein n=1 Tax=Phlyctema vagabunda TaxID=108571 RepID=A0ABR4PSW0_9HELO